MPLKPIGTIEIPASADSSFDHGAFDSKSRRVFVAHTGRDCVEVIDHDTRRFYERHGFVNIEPGEDYRVLCYLREL